MRTARLTFIFSIPCLVALGAGTLPADLTVSHAREPRASTISASGPLLGAYYYLDFPERWSQGYLGAHLRPPVRPMLGEYSLARDTVEEHIRQLVHGGIDLVALSWSRNNPSVDRRVRDEFLQARNVASLRFCFLYESMDLDFDPGWGALGLDRWKAELITADCLYLARTYFQHPSYFRIDGKPVLILYVTRTFVGPVAETIESLRARLRDAGWEVFLVGDEIFWKAKLGTDLKTDTFDPVPWRIRLFDAITSYNLFEAQKPEYAGYPSTNRFLADARRLYERYRAAAGEKTIVLPQVLPGYNDLCLRSSEGRYAVPRSFAPGKAETSTLAHYLSEVALPFLDPRAPLLLITSWNEWNEGTQIEPDEPAAPTSLDDSPSGRDFTQGYAYGGYRDEYLSYLSELLGQPKTVN